MRKRLLTLSFGFGPLLIVFGLIRITHNPIADSLIALIGCTSLSWAMLTLLDLVGLVVRLLEELMISLDEEDPETVTLSILNNLRDMKDGEG
tara:strand:- start:1403 stop:1678 length:276 start_codon:yes stop_codon:yes gene_type:complete